MSEGFDPYLKWLGIRDPQRPVNYYRLLSLELFESDGDIISAAADRQMAHVRTYQSGQYAAYSQRLLNEIAHARAVLLDPQQKIVYDAGLARQRPAERPLPVATPLGNAPHQAAPLPVSPVLRGSSAPVPVTAAPASPAPIISAGGEGASIRVSAEPRGRGRHGSPVALLVGPVIVVLVAVAAAVGGTWYMLSGGGSGGTVAEGGGGTSAGGPVLPSSSGTNGSGTGGSGTNGSGAGGGTTEPVDPELAADIRFVEGRIAAARLLALRGKFTEAEDELLQIDGRPGTKKLFHEVDGLVFLIDLARQARARAEELAAAAPMGTEFPGRRTVKLKARAGKVGRFEENGESLTVSLAADQMPPWLVQQLLIWDSLQSPPGTEAEATAAGAVLNARLAALEALDPDGYTPRKMGLANNAARMQYAHGARLARGLAYDFYALAEAQGMRQPRPTEEDPEPAVDPGVVASTGPAGTPPTANPTPPADPATPDTRPAARRPVSEELAVELRRAFALMAARDTLGAADVLNRAGNLARTPTEQQELANMRRLHALLAEYWNKVDQRVANLQVNEEMGYGLVQGHIRAVEPDRFLLEAGGQEWFAKQRGAYSSALCLWLSRPLLDPLGDRRRLLEAAFEAVDARGDRGRASKSLARAMFFGEDSKAVDLALRYNYESMVALGPTAADPLLAGGNPAPLPGGAQPPTREQVAMPAAEELSGPRAEIRGLFAADYAAAKEPAQRSALARKLMDTAEQTDNSVQRLVLFQEAAFAAAAGGDAALADQYVLRAAQDFIFEPCAKRLEVLQAASNQAIAPDAAAAVLRVADQLAGEAIRTEQFLTAEQAVDLAVNFAAKRRMTVEIRRQLSAMQKQASDIRREFSEVPQARLRLARNPELPADNFLVGRFEALVRNDWPLGTPLLLKAPSAEWRKAAQLDSQSPTTAAEKASVGDAWVKVSELEANDSLRLRIHGRAAHWYRGALAGLSGLEKRRVEVELEKLIELAGPVSTAAKAEKLFDLISTRKWEINWSDSGRTEITEIQREGTGRLYYRMPDGSPQVYSNTLGWTMINGEAVIEYRELNQPIRVRLMLELDGESFRAERYDAQTNRLLATSTSVVLRGGANPPRP